MRASLLPAPIQHSCALQGGLLSLAFGGSDNRSMVRHHGIERFREFSNPRRIVVRGDGADHINAFYGTYRKAAARVDSALGSGQLLKQCRRTDTLHVQSCPRAEGRLRRTIP